MPGQVCPLAPDLGDKTLKVPQIGWNAVHILQDDPIFKYVRDGEYFYYVHSYYGKNCAANTLAVSDYSLPVTGVVKAGRCTALSSTRKRAATRDCGCCGRSVSCKITSQSRCRSTRSGCGTQHPLRALKSTCVLLAAAPTMIPYFRHWRRLSLLLPKERLWLPFGGAVTEGD